MNLNKTLYQIERTPFPEYFIEKRNPFIYFLSTGGSSFAILKAKIIVGRHHDMKKILFVCHGRIFCSE